jgi:hypothetical protein
MNIICIIILLLVGYCYSNFCIEQYNLCNGNCGINTICTGIYPYCICSTKNEKKFILSLNKKFFFDSDGNYYINPFFESIYLKNLAYIHHPQIIF